MPQDSWYLAKEFRGDFEGGKFHNPHDAAVGPDGNVYVCDRYNHRIQVFDKNGNFLLKWGGYGSNAGQLNEPTGIFITPAGKVYVSEFGNSRVQVFDNQGNSLQIIGQQGSGDGQLNHAHGVAVDQGGNVYVGDWDNARVMVFKADGSYLRQWGSRGSSDGQFSHITSLCSTADNKIAVSDCDRALVQVFATDGSFAFKFGSDGEGDGQIHNTYGVKTDQAGNFYVTRRDWTPSVCVFDRSGNFVRSFGANQFNPFSLAVGNGNVFVCDWDNNRMAVYKMDGTFVQYFGSYADASFSTPNGMAKDAQGNVYISDSGNNKIRKYDSNLINIASFGSSGTGNGQFNFPYTMAVSSDQKLYVVDRGNNRVQILDLNGNFLGSFGQNGSGDGQFNNPWGIAIGKDGRVYVADQSNHRIQIFDAQGNFLKKFGKQGGFDGQLQSPQDIVALPNGKFVVGDRGNGRLQIFDAEGNYLNKNGWNPDRISGTADGNLYGAWPGVWWSPNYTVGYFDMANLQEIKSWAPGGGGSGCAYELPSGDLLTACYDNTLRLYKRTYRIAVPSNGNALPLPAIVGQKLRPGTTLVDIDYTVKDADNPTVSTALLAFNNGGNSLNDVIPMKTFAEGTGANLGSNIPTGVTNRVTWDVSQDWFTNFGKMQFEVLAKDNRSLLNIDFLQIPATGSNPALKISRSPLTDNDLLSVWYWLIATGDPSIAFNNGFILLPSFSFTPPTDTTQGLWVTRYSNPDWTGNSQSKVENNINFSTWSDWWDLNSRGASSCYVGMITPTLSGNYQFFIDADDYVDWSLNGQAGQQSGGVMTINLQAGVPAPLVINYNDSGTGWRSMNVRWIPPGQKDWVAVPDSVYTTTVSQPNPASYGSYTLASGSSTTPAGRAFLFAKMGLREATPDEVKRAQEAGTPGVINQWAPKFQVGPGERPAAVNAYGFDTGARGSWVVPIIITNNGGN
jgi:sugar lactone lactonase YvrE